MKIHTDTLTRHDLSDALATIGLAADGVRLDECAEHGSRKRFRRLDVKLSAEPREGRRRQRNTGQYGAEFGHSYGGPLWVAATWDEHGVWMAELFERDPAAVVERYDGREDFHRQTAGRYRIAVAS